MESSPRNYSIKRTCAQIVAIILLGLVAIEIVLRLAGFESFPLFLADRDLGYIPAPNQHGAFLRTYRWRYNEYSMGASSFHPTEHKKNILLLGDSIVMGGNPIDEPQKLGPQLQKQEGSDCAVWPASANSWSFLNEKAYLDCNPSILQAIDTLVWIFNSGDFQTKSIWFSDRYHPRAYPLWLTGFVFDKYMMPLSWERYLPQKWRTLFPNVSNIPIDAAWGEFEQYISSLQRRPNHPKLLICWYPTVQELEFERKKTPPQSWNQLTKKMESFTSQNQVPFLELTHEEEWNSLFYRDDIHPTAEGYSLFAKILYQHLSHIP